MKAVDMQKKIMVNDLKIYNVFLHKIRFFLKRFIAQIIYTVYKDKLQNFSCNQFKKNIYTMVEVELSDMCINKGTNNGTKKLWTKIITATSGKLKKKAVLLLHLCLYFL